MIILLSFLLPLAWADSCRLGAAEFDFSADPDLNRSLVVKGGGKLALPRVGDYPVNMSQARDGKGSLCRNAAVYPLAKDKIAILFETLEADFQVTYLTVYDFKTHAFSPPTVLGQSQLLSEKTEKGFAYLHDPGLGERDGITKGVGAATGLDLVWIQADIWMRAELGPKGLETKLDRDLTWKNSRWSKYITDRAEFEKTFRLNEARTAEKVQVFSGFSREAKKDCIQVEYSGQPKAFCRPITSSNF